MPRRRPEVGGILLGTITVEETITVRIEACLAIPCEHLFGPSYTLSEDEKQTLRHAVMQHSIGDETDMRVVGFYRTHTRRGLALDSDDMQLADLFPEGADLALLIKPRLLRRSQAAILFWRRATEPMSAAIKFTVSGHGSRNGSPRTRKSSCRLNRRSRRRTPWRHPGGFTNTRVVVVVGAGATVGLPGVRAWAIRRRSRSTRWFRERRRRPAIPMRSR